MFNLLFWLGSAVLAVFAALIIASVSLMLTRWIRSGDASLTLANVWHLTCQAASLPLQLAREICNLVHDLGLLLFISACAVLLPFAYAADLTWMGLKATGRGLKYVGTKSWDALVYCCTKVGNGLQAIGIGRQTETTGEVLGDPTEAAKEAMESILKKINLAGPTPDALPG